MTSFYSRVLRYCLTLTVYLVLAASETLVSNPDNLQPEGFNVCTDVQEETYYVRESYQRLEQYKTYTWCLTPPFRCTNWLTRSHLAYRTASRTRFRRTLKCCNGYEMRDIGDQHNHCIVQCIDDCNGANGKCIHPNVCWCYHGFMGDACERRCTDSTWGVNCEMDCICSSEGTQTCDPADGTCICKPGWRGVDCSQPCEGTFGKDCQYQCSCLNGGSCDPVTGLCTCPTNFYGINCEFECVPGADNDTCVTECLCEHGRCVPAVQDCLCDAGYTGKYCNFECDAYSWGPNCVRTCRCYNNAYCNRFTGDCDCPPGYYGNSCEKDCKPEYYGVNCERECECEFDGVCVWNATRDVVCNCTNTGFTGKYCDQKVCPVDKYGDNCDTTCACDMSKTDICHPLTGKCLCRPGYTGADCSQECPAPYWGPGCQSLCQCANGLCNHIDGQCQTCFPGYVGINCDEPCDNQHWGFKCAQECSCTENGVCDKRNGFCHCIVGYKGLTCNETCAAGTFGDNCTQTCPCDPLTSDCSHFTGQCFCNRGYTGADCSEPCPDGTHGYGCRPCDCVAGNTQSCSKVDGTCTCVPGWIGLHCEAKCPFGRWGPNCVHECQCNGRGSCDQYDGTCQCNLGYQSPDCLHKCNEGKYGQDCGLDCPLCQQDEICDPVSGTCINTRCPPGFYGQECELCPDGTYGNKCQYQCDVSCSFPGGKCDPVTGRCTCYPGYKGNNCDTGQDPLGPGKQEGADTGDSTGTSPVVIAVAAVAALLVVILIIVIIFFSRRIRRLKSENHHVTYSNRRDLGGDHTDIGMVNPTYATENLNNESRRVPHLTQQMERTSCEPVANGRPVSCASAMYDDLDGDDRYTTLKSIGQPDTRNSTLSACNDYNPGYNKTADKFMLYTGRKVPNEQGGNGTAMSDGGSSKDNLYKPNNLALANLSPPTNPKTVDQGPFEDMRVTLPAQETLQYDEPQIRSDVNRFEKNATNINNNIPVPSQYLTPIPADYDRVPHGQQASLTSGQYINGDSLLRRQLEPHYDTPRTNKMASNDSSSSGVSSESGDMSRDQPDIDNVASGRQVIDTEPDSKA